MKLFCNRLKRAVFGLSLFLATFTTSIAEEFIGCPVTLAWDASPDASVTGYALYYGLADESVTNRVDVGPAQSVTLTNLYAVSNYFFYVVAYNVLGMESVPSGVLTYSPLALTKLRMSTLEDGSTVLQFRSGAGSPCRVEYSSTLNATQWQTLTVTNADSGGDVSIHDPTVGQVASRFYRAARP
jgi:hypothetical protein